MNMHLLGASLVALIVADPAFAQDQPQGPSTSATDTSPTAAPTQPSSSGNSIVITGRRRKELDEAVGIDGGSWRDKFRYVTWPHLIPTLGSTALTLGILYLTLITLLIVLTGGGPLGATTTLSFEVFRGTVQAVNIGPTAVYSIAILLANVGLGVLYMRLTGRVTA